jgi:hypothetical protein
MDGGSRNAKLSATGRACLEVSKRFEKIIMESYQRNVSHDCDYRLKFPFSLKRKVSVYIDRSPQNKHDSCFVATVYIFDPSLTFAETEHCWDGMSPIHVETFSDGEFVADLGLASLNGGLASVALMVHFHELSVGTAAHTLMLIAGLVDMYTR